MPNEKEKGLTLQITQTPASSLEGVFLVFCEAQKKKTAFLESALVYLVKQILRMKIKFRENDSSEYKGERLKPLTHPHGFYIFFSFK